MATLGKAVIELSADTAKFVSDMGRTAAVFEKGMARMQRGIGDLRNAFIGLAGAGGFGLMIKSAVDIGDQLNKLSQKAGISVESLSALRFGAELADVNLEGLTVGLKEFNKSIAEAADGNSKAAQIFKALGVDITQGPEPALRQFAEAISKLPDGATKTKVAVELLGKAGSEMIPWLNQGAAGMDRAAESAKRLGLVVSADFAARAEQFNDNLKTLGKLTDALAISLAGPVLPGLASLTQNLAAAAEAGNLLIGAVKEMLKLSVALGSVLPGALGVPFKLGAELLFREEPGSSFNMPGARGGGATSAPLNAEQIACAASGGKWIDGRCVRSGEKGEDLVGRQLAEDAEEWIKIMSEAAQATDDFNKRMREMERDEARGMTQAEADAWVQIIENMQEYETLIGQLQAGFDGFGNSLEKATKNAYEFGFTFSSQLEDAIINGKKLDEVINAIARDIARMIIRKAITEPLGNLIGGALAGAFSGGGTSATEIGHGGGIVGQLPHYHEGGFAAGEQLAVLREGEGVFTPEQMAAMGGMNVNFNISAVDGPSVHRVLIAQRRTIEGIIRRAYHRGGRESGMAS